MIHCSVSSSFVYKKRRATIKLLILSYIIVFVVKLSITETNLPIVRKILPKKFERQFSPLIRKTVLYAYEINEASHPHWISKFQISDNMKTVSSDTMVQWNVSFIFNSL